MWLFLALFLGHAPVPRGLALVLDRYQLPRAQHELVLAPRPIGQRGQPVVGALALLNVELNWQLTVVGADTVDAQGALLAAGLGRARLGERRCATDVREGPWHGRPGLVIDNAEGGLVEVGSPIHKDGLFYGVGWLLQLHRTGAARRER